MVGIDPVEFDERRWAVVVGVGDDEKFHSGTGELPTLCRRRGTAEELAAELTARGRAARVVRVSVTVTEESED